MASSSNKIDLVDLIEQPSGESNFSWRKYILGHPLTMILAVLGGGLLVVGAVFLYRDLQSSFQVTIIPVEEGQAESAGQIMVHVAGAVQRPGLYQLSSQARINDALVAAGGLNENANREWFAKNINLAQKLSDGVKLYIPFASESVGTQNEISDSQILGQSNSSLININTASQAELENLPKIGAVLAQRIIDYRESHGRFEKIEDLLNVS